MKCEKEFDQIPHNPSEQAQLRAAVALVGGRPPGWIDELDPDTGTPKVGSRDFALFSYNQFWFDQGASLASKLQGPLIVW